MTTWTGPLIRHMRLRLGWSKSELGRRLGLTLSQITKMEKGQLSIDSELINQLDHLKRHSDEICRQNRNRPLFDRVMQENNFHQADLSHLDKD